MTTTLLDDYLLPAQLASELKISTKTLERWRIVGAAPPVTRVGRRIYFARESVAKWLQAREQKPRSRAA
jgi:predicted site-specific integrase-resolvase